MRLVTVPVKSFFLAATLTVLSVGTCGCTDDSALSIETASGAKAPEAVSVDEHHTAADTACSGCVLARLRNRACVDCGTRYVAGLEIPSETLFELLDAHGHTYKAEGLQCPGCREASESDGLCPEHGWGFTNDQLYFSKLSYLLAHGTPHTRSTLDCPTCRGAKATTWCERCGRGWVGNVSFYDRKQHDAAVVEYDHLVSCVETATTCEMCASARFSGMKCPKCKIQYPERR